MLIKDNGKGFAPGEKNDGLGLINMAQRAELLGGNLTVVSPASPGTKIYVHVPLLPGDAIPKQSV
jgi:signal transduction histidine kinase